MSARITEPIDAPVTPPVPRHVTVFTPVPSNVNGTQLAEEISSALSIRASVALDPETNRLEIRGIPPGKEEDVERLASRHTGEHSSPSDPRDAEIADLKKRIAALERKP